MEAEEFSKTGKAWEQASLVPSSFRTRLMQDTVRWARASCTMVGSIAEFVKGENRCYQHHMTDRLRVATLYSVSTITRWYSITLFCFNYHLQYFVLCVWVDNFLALSLTIVQPRRRTVPIANLDLALCRL